MQALVGVTVIVIGLVVTLVLHFTHDSDGPHPTPVPVSISPTETASTAPHVPGASGETGAPCCGPPAPAALGGTP